MHSAAPLPTNTLERVTCSRSAMIARSVSLRSSGYTLIQRTHCCSVGIYSSGSGNGFTFTLKSIYELGISMCIASYKRRGLAPCAGNCKQTPPDRKSYCCTSHYRHRLLNMLTFQRNGCIANRWTNGYDPVVCIHPSELNT